MFWVTITLLTIGAVVLAISIARMKPIHEESDLDGIKR